MAKNSIRDFSATASSNTDIQSVDIDENCAASGINNAIRELMADLADVDSGTVALTSPQADNLTVTGTVTTDTIAENTSAAGVTIDGVLLKDGGVGSATAAITAYLSSLNGGQLGGNRNLIINGACTISQRGTSSTDFGYGSVDRFRSQKFNFDELVLTHEQVTDAPTGFSNSLKYTVTTPETTMDADEHARIEYRIEGQDLQHLKKGTSDAVSLTLSFWVKGSITGTYIATLADTDNSRNICASYTINSANTWEYKTLTYAGDTTGTLNNDNQQSFAVRFWLGAGTDRTSGTLATSWEATVTANVAVGQTNILTTSGATFQITGIQLEVGEQATPFEHRSYGDELQRCMRYYNTSGIVVASGTPDRYHNQINLPVEMRSSPTITTAAIDSGSGATMVSTWDRENSANSSKAFYQGANNTVLSSARFTFDAEL